ncbi:hypothetical protein LTR09_004249 [Extremus antarcticus]|uniref:Heterokaryon incompatibility domain-containing protein n=1 Tax=Extremus antarcticus TaxID=702011 RepID=A0AAJ0DQV3_9PEZI|nr:hypothetical protein LTR09_004249 [Extremus antarcticus]
MEAHSRAQIRLLYLERSVDYSSPLTGRLEVHSLPRSVPPTLRSFVALSYTWSNAISDAVPVPIHDGLANDSATLSSPRSTTATPDCIFIDGKPLPIGENLAAFLRHSRRCNQGENIPLWIDAICINQKGDREKSQQISLIGFIYSLATKVVVWLGPPTANSDLGMKWLDKLGSGSPYWKMPLLSSRTLTAIQNLLLRRWWTRVWIIQEIVAGGFHIKLHAIEVWCGERTTTWMRVVIAAARMRAYRDDRRQYFPNIDRVLELDALRDSALGLSLAGPYRCNIESPLHSPTAMLIRCRRYDSTDPKDKVDAIYH